VVWYSRLSDIICTGGASGGICSGLIRRETYEPVSQITRYSNEGFLCCSFGFGRVLVVFPPCGGFRGIDVLHQIIQNDTELAKLSEARNYVSWTGRIVGCISMVGFGCFTIVRRPKVGFTVLIH
jgi:hypothetical protein